MTLPAQASDGGFSSSTNVVVGAPGTNLGSGPAVVAPGGGDYGNGVRGQQAIVTSQGGATAGNGVAGVAVSGSNGDAFPSSQTTTVVTAKNTFSSVRPTVPVRVVTVWPKKLAWVWPKWYRWMPGSL